MKEKKEPFTINKRIKSIGFALQGIKTLLKGEHNTWIHLAATFVVIVAAFLFNVSILSWFMLIVAIALVWILEAINTAIEFLVDLASPDYHPLAKKAKDVAAAAVLFASILAVILGILVLYNEWVHSPTTC